MLTSSGAPIFLFLSLAASQRATYDDGPSSPTMRPVNEVNATGDNAIITVGMAAVFSEEKAVKDFVKAHQEYADEFGHFAEHALWLASKVLGTF